ncbi:hypothetical protein THAOC_19537, partial [Thalassiosira oceanica]
MYSPAPFDPTNDTALTPGVGDQPVDRGLRAVDDVDDPRGQPEVVQDLRKEERRRRSLLGGLEDVRVPRGDGEGDHPQRY